ncbi:MAG TPA: DUF2147 domain-containing protein [Dissulfurispiraceae bacterium]|nr:DUF2147 domain-containing protein [Dissulfurispiraceae bacterium]
MVRFLLIIVFMPIVVSSAAAAGGDTIMGAWLNEEGDAVIEIFKCSDHYCGKIVWIKEPDYPSSDAKQRGGKPRLDDLNPDAELRPRPILGLRIMNDFRYRGDTEWIGGTIYDPKSGYTYRGKMTLVSENTLHLRGYVIFSLFGRNSTWTRYVEKHH